MPDAPALSIGAVLGGRYRIEARIGAGGMGVVYRAQDDRLGRAVALKVVSQKGGSMAVRRLQREARAVASLEHRGIAMLFDVLDIADVGVVLVMELVRGESLRTLIEDEGPRRPREAATLVLDVAESLGAAHRAGLVHRDVKPDNILVRPDGRTALLDFGIAKAITERSDDSSGDPVPFELTGDTTEGLVVGTPAYLAPEQALASADISGAADQFALAVVAYEVLTGTSPWRSATSGALLIAQIVGGEAPRPSTLRPELGGAVDEVLGRALKKDPAARFPTIEEFGVALLTAVGQIPGVSSAPRMGIPRSRPLALPYAKTLRVAPDAETAEALPVVVPKRRSLAIPLLTAATAVALAAGVVGARALRASPTVAAVPSPVIAPAPSASTVKPLTYAELPRSTTPSPDAERALRDAMIALRDANDALAEQRLKAAIDLDPSFASAHLQRAILKRRDAWGGMGNQLAGRDDFIAATAGRDTLPPRERALLDAFEPTFNLLPSDVAATGVRMAALGTDAADAQTWNLIGRVLRQLEKLDSAEAAFDRELAIDPQSAAGLNSRAALYTARGDLDHAAASYEQCFRTQPRATLCRFNLATVLEWNGKCDAFVQRSREYAALAPDDKTGSYMKLMADAAAGLSRATLEDEVHSLDPFEQINESAWLHELNGELGPATRFLSQLEAKSFAERDTATFAYARVAHLVELDEMGLVGEATDLASSYDARIATLPPLDDIDQLPYVLSVLRHAGKLSDAEAGKRRQTWIDRWLPQYTTPQQRFILWIAAWARPALDEDDARAAVAAIPAFMDELPVSSLFWLPAPWSDHEAVARTLVLARHPRARSFVDEAMKDCVPNFYGVRLRRWAGELAEREGNIPGACASYAFVVDRWGHAKPRSVDADAARARMTALGCGAAAH